VAATGTDGSPSVGSITRQEEPRPVQTVTGWPRLFLRLAGAGLLAATAAMHLDLYLTGYRTIPTIGWLFLLQVIAAFALALAVLVTGSRLAAAAGAGFALATLGGYLLSVWFGLFGFKEVRTTAGIVAGVIEVAAAAALGMLALTPARAAGGRHQAGAGAGVGARLRAGVPHAGWLVTGVSVLALAVLGGSVAVAGGVPAYSSAGGGGLKTAQVGGATVLVNAKGFTLYWFAADTATKSHCEGTCSQYWIPLKGPATLSAGVTGQLGTIKRSDGSVQATFDGHPLYTYVSDTAPGQNSGDGVNLDGGLWHEVKVS
jgi:predicted lipoprotein with Yx(FWY)xxD motif